MDVFDVLAKIELDDREYQSGMDRAIARAMALAMALESVLAAAAKTGAGALGAAGQAVLYFSEVSFKAKSTFESAMMKVSAASGQAGGELDVLAGKAETMRTAVATSSEESVQALRVVAVAAGTVGDAMGGAEGEINRAAASEVGLATSSQLAASRLDALSVAAKNDTQMVGVLSAAYDSASSSVVKMSDTVKAVGPAADGLADSAQGAANAVEIMAGRSVEASQVGISLRTVMVGLKQPATEAADAMEELKQPVQKAADAMEELEQPAAKAADAVEELKQPVQKAADAMEELEQPAAKAADAVEDLGKSAGEGSFQSGMSKAVEKCKALAQALGKGLSIAAKASVAALREASKDIGDFVKDSVKAGLTFDSAMSDVAAASGATGAQYDALRDKAVEMGAKTKFSATESAQALSQMAAAGWKTGDMLGGIEGVMNLAAASGESLASASGLVTGTLDAFGLTAADCARVADVLAAASGSAGTGVSQMAEAFKAAGPAAGEMGFSMEDTAAAIALMVSGGIGASEAGESLKAVMQGLTQPTAEAEAALASLGISITDGQGNMKSLQEIMLQMREGFSGLTEAEQASYAAMLGGQEAASGLLAIVGASDAEFAKFTAAVQNADGAAQEMAAAVSDNLAGDITLFQNAVMGAQVAISDQLAPALRDFVSLGTQSVASMTEAFQAGGLEGLASAVNDEMGKWVEAILAFAPEVVEVGSNLVQVLTDMAPDLIDAAAELIAGIAYSLADALPVLLPELVNLLMGIAQALLDNSPLLLDAAGQLILALGEGLIASLPILIDALPALIAGIVEFLLNSIGQIVEVGSQLLTAIAEALPEIITGIAQIVPDIISGLIDALTDSIPLLVEAGIDLLLALVMDLPQIVEGIANAVPRIIDGVVSAVKEAWPALMQSGKEMFEKLVEQLPQAIEAIRNRIPEIWRGIVEKLKEAWDEMANAGRNLVEGLWRGISDAADWLWGKVSGFVNGIVGKVKGVLGIRSPSKVFASIGQDMALGLGAGWADEYDRIRRDIEGGMEFATPQVAVASGGRAALGGAGETVNVYVNLPGGSLNTAADAQAMGRIIGQQAARQIRYRGGLGLA